MKNFFKFSILVLLVILFSNYFFENISFGAESQVQDPDFVYKITAVYKQKAETWGVKLIVFTKQMFVAFLLIDILMFGFSGGIGMATGNKNIASVMGELILNVILPASFIFVVISNYQSWSVEIITVFTNLAKDIEPSSIGANSFFGAGLSLCDKIYSQLDFWSPSSWPLLFIGLIILIIYALISMQIILIKCEAYIVLNAGIIMLGFGAFAQTRQYAMNFIRYILSVGIKLFVMQLMIGLAFSFVEDFVKSPMEIRELNVVLGASIVMLGLIRVIPDICAGIIQGQHVGTGNALSGAISSVAAGAMGALAVGKSVASNIGGLANTAKSISGAMGAASDAGLHGMSKAGFVAKTMAGAMGGEANKNSAMGSFASRLVSQAEGNASGINAKNKQNAEDQQLIKNALKL